MISALPLTCSSCGARYVLPAALRQQLEGRAAFCVTCERWWVPLPASNGPAVKLVKGRPERAPVDLGDYRQAGTGTMSPARGPSGQPPGVPSRADSRHPAPGAGVTTRVQVPTVSHSSPTLRVVISVPATGQSRKGVFELGSKSFLIGQAGCHLNLPKATIPPRAIRIRVAGKSFQFEGIAGFAVPIGTVSVVSGQIEQGGAVCFQLAPYELQLEPSTTPGRPIADLEPAVPPTPASRAPDPPTPVPSSPMPQPPIPQAPIPQAPILQAPAPSPFSAPISPGAGRPGGHDLRNQLQELAIEVRPDQSSFGADADAVQAALDGDQTITDLGAQGFQAMRFGNPLEGLDVQLIRADGPAKGQAFKVTKSPVVVGRSGGDMIIHDRRVSSKHAQLDVSGPRIYTLKDLASTNGTAVNDRPISVGHLQDGDVISFGGVTFNFKVNVKKR